MAQAAIETCLCSRASAEYFCMECEQYFCDTCRISHKRAKVSKNHHLVETLGAKEKEWQLLLCDIKGTDAVKLMSLFNMELKEMEAKHLFTVVKIANPPTIKVIGKESERRVAKAVTERWLDLLQTLQYDVISGNSIQTFANVEKIILRHNLKDRVLPIQCNPPNEKIVRMYSKKRSYIDMVRYAYDNPDPWDESFVKFK